VKIACVEAAERAQAQRLDGRLLDARASAAECARDFCPAAVRRDCAAWLRDMVVATPSVVFRVHGPDGQAPAGLRVRADGGLLPEGRATAAVPLDPGVHRFAFEAPGMATVEHEVVVDAGRHEQVVEVTMAIVAAAPAALVAAPDHAPRGMTALRVGLFGLGGAGLVAFASLSIPAHFDASNLRASCGPNCPQSDVDSLRVRLLVGDIGLAVGVASLGVATLLTLLPRPSRSVALGAVPLLHGAAASCRVTF
jgi:hypothetical protein